MIEALESRFLMSLTGDTNHDTKVNLTDFTILAANFNGVNKTWEQGDFNSDTRVDLTDFTFLTGNYGRTEQPIQQMINAAAAGAVINVPSGIYNETLSISKSITLTGSYVIVENSGRSTALTMSQGTIENFIFRGCSNQLQTYQAAIRLGDNAKFINVTAEKMEATAIGVLGANCLLKNVIAQDNGQSGISTDNARFLTMTNCVNRRNNTGLPNPVWKNTGPIGGYNVVVFQNGLYYTDPDFEAVSKIWNSSDILVDGLDSYDNVGPGGWTDYNNARVTFRNCKFHNNIGLKSYQGNGLRLELTPDPGQMVIENCLFWGNSGGDISVEQSRHVIIRNNDMTNGVVIRDYDRGSQYRVFDVVISNNIFRNKSRIVFWEIPFGTGGVSESGNTYLN